MVAKARYMLRAEKDLVVKEIITVIFSLWGSPYCVVCHFQPTFPNEIFTCHEDSKIPVTFLGISRTSLSIKGRYSQSSTWSCCHSPFVITIWNFVLCSENRPLSRKQIYSMKELINLRLIELKHYWIVYAALVDKTQQSGFKKFISKPGCHFTVTVVWRLDITEIKDKILKWLWKGRTIFWNWKTN